MCHDRRFLAILTAALIVVGACSSGGGASGSSGTNPGSAIAGVVIERAAGRSHRQGDLDYPGKKPPSGGNHNPIPLTCGFYDQQPPDEFAVHSLEHGAVWIAYGPSVSPADVLVLRAFAKHDHVIVSPYAGMDSPISIVAWEHRLEVAAASDPRIGQFVDAFANGPTAPERGGACSGAGTPLTP